MSWEHAAEARAALNAIVTDPQHGVGALSSAQTMSNLLKDLLPDAPREKSILVAAAEAGLADSLRQHVGQGMDPDTAIRLTASQFSSSTPFTPEACNWVTGEIATALGMSHSTPVGPGGAGGAGGAQGGFDQGGMPTQITPIPGAGYAPGQQPTQGRAAPGGQGGFGAGGQATAPGPWQAGGQQAGGQQAGGQQGGFGQQGGYGQQGGFGQPAAPGGFGQGQPGFGGQQAGGGWQGGQQAGTPWQGAQPGGYGQQQGFGQQGVSGWQPGAPTGPIGPGGPVRPRGNKRGLWIGGGIAAVVVIAVVASVALAGGGKPNPSPTPNPTPPVSSPASPSPSTPATSPAAAHPAGTDSLQTIMNPPGLKPVGTECVAAKLFGLDPATLDASTFCAKTQRPNITVWGYQFDSFADYQKGLAHINHYVGFDKVTPGTSCPPSSGSTTGKVGWHAISNPKYKSRTGQDIECLIDNQKPVLIWTMPTQDVFFIGQNSVQGSSLTTMINWWKILNYG